MVDERGSQGGKWEDGQAGLETAVKAGSGDETKWPLPSDEQESEKEVDDLQDRYRLDGGVKGFCEEIPKDLGPEETLQCGCDLVCEKC